MVIKDITKKKSLFKVKNGSISDHGPGPKLCQNSRQDIDNVKCPNKTIRCTLITDILHPHTFYFS